MGLQDKHGPPVHIYLCSLKCGEPLYKSSSTGNIRLNLFIQTLGLYCCADKCRGDTNIFRLNFPTNNGCAQYCSSAPIGHSSLTWQQPRMNICAIGIALARTDVPRCACRQRLQARFSPRERHHKAPHYKARQGDTADCSIRLQSV